MIWVGLVGDISCYLATLDAPSCLFWGKSLILLEIMSGGCSLLSRITADNSPRTDNIFIHRLVRPAATLPLA